MSSAAIVHSPRFCRRASRFWRKVDQPHVDSCWPWTGLKNEDGYGIACGPTGRNVYAHRWSWELLRGPIPDGMCVLHRCDNPPCCNPTHLFLGDRTDNAIDKTEKGRVPRGAAHWTALHPELITTRGERQYGAKLTDDDVRAIRTRAGSGEAQRKVARAFGISQGHVSNIVRHLKWGHVE